MTVRKLNDEGQIDLAREYIIDMFDKSRCKQQTLHMIVSVPNILEVNGYANAETSNEYLAYAGTAPKMQCDNVAITNYVVRWHYGTWRQI